MIRKQFVLWLVLVAFVAAVTAPTALAKPVSGDTLNGGYDPWAYSLVYQSTHPMSAQQTGPLDPWAYGLVYQSTHPMSAQQTGPLDPWAYGLVHKTPVTTSSSSSFDFSDAGIGAAITFGVALILLTMAVAGLKYRRAQRSRLAIS